MIRTNKGFTLVELMVVIVIIGVLAALAIPKFTDASAKAKLSEGPTICGTFDNAVLARIGETGQAATGWADLVMQQPQSKFYVYTAAWGVAVDNDLTGHPIVATGDVAADDEMGTRVNIEAGNFVSHWQVASYDKYLPNWGAGDPEPDEVAD